MKKLFAATLAIASTLGASSLGAVSTIAGGDRLPTVGTSNPNLVRTVLATNGKLPNSSHGKPEVNPSNSFAKRSLAIAQVIPRDAVGFAILDLDLNSWRVLEQFDLPAKSPLNSLDALFSFLEIDDQISVAADVQPWIGNELAIAFFAREKGDDCVCFGSAIIAQVTDRPKFEALVTKLATLDLPKPTQTTYKQVVIREWNLEEEETTAKALTKNHQEESDDDQNDADETESEDFLPAFGLRGFAIANLPNGTAVFASDRQTIEQIIDTANNSLAEDPLFLRSLQNPLWNRSLLAGYGNYANLGRLTELLAADLPEESPIPGLSRGEYIQTLKYTISEYSTFDLFTWITPKGIRSQSISYFTQARPPKPRDTASRDRLLSLLPNNVYSSVSSRDLNQQWQWLVKESEKLPVYKVFVEGVRMIVPLVVGTEGAKYLNIEKDILSWMDGEYAFVVFSSDRSPLKSFGVNLTMGMLIRTSQPDAANALLAKLTKFAKESEEKSFLRIKKRQVGATLLTSFEYIKDLKAGTTESVFAFGWRDPKTLLLTFGSDTAAEFIPTPKSTLADSEMFREAIADMPQPNFGYFYLNMNAIARQVANIALTAGAFPVDEDRSNNEAPQLPAIADQLINKFGGAVFVYSETSDRLQADAFFGLRK